MSDGGRRLRAMSFEEQAMMALAALIVAIGALWLTRVGLAEVWPGPSQVNLWNWTWSTLTNYRNAPYLHAEWLKLWQIDYHHYLVVLAFVGLGVWSTIFAFGTERPLKTALFGALAGATAGYIGGIALPFVLPSPSAFHAVLAQPVGILVLGLIGVVLVAPRRPDPVVRGARVEEHVLHAPSPNIVDKAIRERRVVFAGTMLEPEAETTHCLSMGTSGSGKTTATKALLATAIARGDAMVVADPGGEAMGLFRREGDVVLNPSHPDCAKWDIFSDIRSDDDYNRTAAALLPLPSGEDGKDWKQEGRDLLADLMRAYRQLDIGGSDDFAHFLRTATPDMMGELLRETDAGTESKTLFDEGNERTRGSVLKQLAPAKRLLRRMAEIEAEPFSIREWVREGRGRLWLPYEINQLDSLRLAIGCWLSAAALEKMSLTQGDPRRLWFVVDELDLLGRVADLEIGLSNGRRFGACFVLGFQSIAQLRGTYGDHVASAIEENVGTRLVLRSEGFGPGGTAEFASRMIGEREVAYEDVSFSGPHGSQPGTTSRSVRHRIERAVLPAEIGQLATLTGYLKVAGAGAWRMVRVPLRDYPPSAVGDGHPSSRKAA